MSLADISKSLVYAGIIYVFALIYGANFIVSNISYGGLTLDFFLIALIIKMPIVFYVLYFAKPGFIEGRESLVKNAAIVTSALATIFVLVFIIPLTI